MGVDATIATPTRAPDAPSGAARPRARHLPGLDGLRAVAIAAVLLFHLDPTWLPGGFLGVDVFFVISGFLITTLLVREREATGGVDLKGFWTRRARRLLPALLVVVPSCILIARTVEADLLVGIGRQTLGALTFSTNWLEIAHGSDYFNATSPQLFMNFWSLAVEEQFYLFWPLACLGLLALRHRLRVSEGVIAGLVVGLGLTSAAMMALRYDPEAPTRVYYGTDTHLAGLMLGSALAFWWAGPTRAGTTGRVWVRYRRAITAGALVGLAGLFWFADEGAAWTFRIGILAASVATAVLVLAAIDRPGPLRTALELPPLTWIGQRSYGIYLWHWPVILIIGQDAPTAAGTTAFLWSRLWAVVVILALADLSFRFIETPVRRRGFRGTARVIGGLLAMSSERTRRGALAVAVILAVVLTAVLVTAPDKSSTQQVIEQNSAAASGKRDTKAAKTFTGKKSFTMPKGKDIDIFGDSMVVGSVPALRYYFPGVQISAKSNQQWHHGYAEVHNAGRSLRRAVVLAYGTNAGTDEATIRKTLDLIGPDRMVVLVNLHGDRLSRIPSDNKQLAAIASDYPNVTVANWNAAAAGSPTSLQPDGIHPSLTGAHLYANTIRKAFAGLSEKHTGQEVTLKDLPIP